MKIEFDIGYSYAKWEGEYTIGDVGIRGTRLWFRMPHTLSLDCTYCQGDMKEFDDVQKSLLLNDDIPQGYYHIQEKSLKSIISILKGKKERSRHGDIFFFKGNMKELTQFIDGDSWSYNNIYLDKVSEDKKYDILVGSVDGSVLFFMYDKEGIIHELKEVLEKCNEYGVKWEWI